MGSALARELALAGRDVLVLEKAIPGAEASSAAAGILGGQAEADHPGPFLDFCMRSREMYADYAAALKQETGIDIGYRRCGLLKVAYDDYPTEWIEDIIALQRESGLDHEVLSPAELRKLEPAISDLVVKAVHFKGDAQVDNRLLVQALTQAATKAGARYQSGYMVKRVLTKDGRATGVELDRESVQSEIVCICAGSWSSLVDGLPVPPDLVVPVRGQMIMLQVKPQVLGRVVFTKDGYLVPRVDGRIIVGSTVEFAGFEKRVTPAGLRKILDQLARVLPGADDAQVIETWAGLRPCTKDFLPIIGELEVKGLFMATGHFRNGILLTPATARLLGQMINGQKPFIDPEPFAWERFGAV